MQNLEVQEEEKIHTIQRSLNMSKIFQKRKKIAQNYRQNHRHSQINELGQSTDFVPLQDEMTNLVNFQHKQRQFNQTTGQLYQLLQGQKEPPFISQQHESQVDQELNLQNQTSQLQRQQNPKNHSPYAVNQASKIRVVGSASGSISATNIRRKVYSQRQSITREVQKKSPQQNSRINYHKVGDLRQQNGILNSENGLAAVDKATNFRMESQRMSSWLAQSNDPLTLLQKNSMLPKTLQKDYQSTAQSQQSLAGNQEVRRQNSSQNYSRYPIKSKMTQSKRRLTQMSSQVKVQELGMQDSYNFSVQKIADSDYCKQRNDANLTNFEQERLIPQTIPQKQSKQFRSKAAKYAKRKDREKEEQIILENLLQRQEQILNQSAPLVNQIEKSASNERISQSDNIGITQQKKTPRIQQFIQIKNSHESLEALKIKSVSKSKNFQSPPKGIKGKNQAYQESEASIQFRRWVSKGYSSKQNRVHKQSQEKIVGNQIPHISLLQSCGSDKMSYIQKVKLAQQDSDQIQQIKQVKQHRVSNSLDFAAKLRQIIQEKTLQNAQIRSSVQKEKLNSPFTLKGQPIIGDNQKLNIPTKSISNLDLPSDRKHSNYYSTLRIDSSRYEGQDRGESQNKENGNQISQRKALDQKSLTKNASGSIQEEIEDEVHPPIIISKRGSKTQRIEQDGNSNSRKLSDIDPNSHQSQKNLLCNNDSSLKFSENQQQNLVILENYYEQRFQQGRRSEDILIRNNVEIKQSITKDDPKQKRELKTERSNMYDRRSNPSGDLPKTNKQHSLATKKRTPGLVYLNDVQSRKALRMQQHQGKSDNRLKSQQSDSVMMNENYEDLARNLKKIDIDAPQQPITQQNSKKLLFPQVSPLKQSRKFNLIGMSTRNGPFQKNEQSNQSVVQQDKFIQNQPENDDYAQHRQHQQLGADRPQMHHPIEDQTSQKSLKSVSLPENFSKNGQKENNLDVDMKMVGISQQIGDHGVLPNILTPLNQSSNSPTRIRDVLNSKENLSPKPASHIDLLRESTKQIQIQLNHQMASAESDQLQLPAVSKQSSTFDQKMSIEKSVALKNQKQKSFLQNNQKALTVLASSARGGAQSNQRAIESKRMERSFPHKQSHSLTADKSKAKFVRNRYQNGQFSQQPQHSLVHIPSIASDVVLKSPPNPSNKGIIQIYSVYRQTSSQMRQQSQPRSSSKSLLTKFEQIRSKGSGLTKIMPKNASNERLTTQNDEQVNHGEFSVLNGDKRNAKGKILNQTEQTVATIAIDKVHNKDSQGQIRKLQMSVEHSQKDTIKKDRQSLISQNDGNSHTKTEKTQVKKDESQTPSGKSFSIQSLLQDLNANYISSRKAQLQVLFRQTFSNTFIQKWFFWRLPKSSQI